MKVFHTLLLTITLAAVLISGGALYFSPSATGIRFNNRAEDNDLTGQIHSIQQQVSDVICPTSTTFTANYYNIGLTDKIAAYYLDLLQNCTLWQDLKNITLDFRENQITSLLVFSSPLSKIKNPVSLSIILSNNLINDEGLLPLENMFQLMDNLTFLQIYLTYNKLTKITPMKAAFQQLHNLEKLQLIIDNNQINDLSSLQTAFQGLNNLQDLDLNFYLNSEADLSSLHTAFQGLEKLKSLSLHLVENRVTDAAIFMDAFNGLISLKSLQLILSFNQIKTGIEELCIGIYETISRTNAFCPFYFSISGYQLSTDQQNQLKDLDNQLQQLYKQAQCPAGMTKRYNFY